MGCNDGAPPSQNHSRRRSMADAQSLGIALLSTLTLRPGSFSIDRTVEWEWWVRKFTRGLGFWGVMMAKYSMTRVKGGREEVQPAMDVSGHAS